MYDIVVIGSATRDIFLSTRSFGTVKSDEFITGEGLCLGLGSKIEIEKLVLTSGGGGTNAAVTFARQGLNTSCIGVIGQDANGREILDELKAEGVDVQHFQTHTDDLTAYSVILVHQSGERSILSYKGEGQHFDASKIDFTKLKSRWLYVDSLGGHIDLLEKAIAWATENSVKVAINPGGKELALGLEALKPAFSQCTIVAMSQEEAAQLTGIDYEKEGELLNRMDKIVKGIFIMTKGPHGVCVTDDTNIYRAGVPDSPIVERTGAGDAFNSGFVAEYMRATSDKRQVIKEGIIKAIQFATANASSVVTRYGSKAGILKKNDWGPWPLVEVEVRAAEK